MMSFRYNGMEPFKTTPKPNKLSHPQSHSIDGRRLIALSALCAQDDRKEHGQQVWSTRKRVKKKSILLRRIEGWERKGEEHFELLPVTSELVDVPDVACIRQPPYSI